MKAIQSFVLAAIVMGTSACASNAAKPSPAASSAMQPASGTIAMSSGEPQALATVSPAQPATEALAAATSAASNTVTVGIDAPPNSPDVPARALAGTTAPTHSSAQVGDTEDPYAKSPVRDPWEGFNRKMHGFNNALDRFVLRPVAVGYDKVVPDPVQSGVSRFFANLRLPATAINQALQGRPAHAGQTLGRFAVNTTVGVAGVFDPATHFGVPQRDGEDFGQTLATWGWRDSRYLVMPLLGPRTVRDTVSIAVDSPMSPISQIDKSGVADKLTVMQMVDGRARLLPMNQVRKDALDDYTFVRDAWAQRRNRQIEQDLHSNRVE